MLTTIPVSSASGGIERYRELLREDWSRETLDGALSLLKKLIARGLKPAAFPWQNVLLLEKERKSSKQFDPLFLARIRDFSLVLREPSVPAMPDHFTASRPTRSAAQAEQVWAYLMLQAVASLEGATGLFIDAQSLLYLCSAHFLLPHLREQRLTAEHDCLVCAMYVHTVLVWRTRPSHFLYLQSALMDHLRNPERRLELLGMSFHFTPPEDHSYLTKATAYWSDLMELRRYNEAEQFLLRVTRTAPPSCGEEIQDMLRETVLAEHNGSN